MQHFPIVIVSSDCCFSCCLLELCLRNLNSLSAIDLIDMDEDINIKPTGAVERGLIKMFEKMLFFKQQLILKKLNC